jgi:hypothetical protein
MIIEMLLGYSPCMFLGLERRELDVVPSQTKVATRLFFRLYFSSKMLKLMVSPSDVFY